MLKVQNICVNYSYKTVLSGVTLNFEQGKIYALLGENGAGKSTLSKVICGDIKATSGQILIDGKEVVFNNPHAAIEKGIVCVHQRPLLAPSISIGENILLGQKRVEKNEVAAVLKEWLPDYEEGTLVGKLELEDWFFVSLSAALLRKPSFLILDEPPFIAEEKLRSLASSGITILIITHNLAQAMKQSDKIILLQEGKVLEEKESALFTENEIKQKLFGISKEVALPSFIEKEDVSEDDVFALHAVGPIEGSGKIGYIPSDKTFRASNPKLTILQLVTAYHTEKKRSEREAFARELLDKAQVNIRLDEKAVCLSGGMLQRLILEREIAENPSRLYLFNPTKGLDVEGTERLYSKLESLAQNGTRIILGNA